MKWSIFKSKVKDEIEATYNMGLSTETLVFKNGLAITKYDPVKKQKSILEQIIMIQDLILTPEEIRRESVNKEFKDLTVYDFKITQEEINKAKSITFKGYGVLPYENKLKWRD